MKSIMFVSWRILTVCALAGLHAAAIEAYSAETTVQLNGIEIGLDADTGAIVKIAYSSAGTILEASGDKASLIELAYPLTEFEPLRLASRFTWNWRDYSDLRPLLSLLTDGPRINVNINWSIPDVVRGFADNAYLNVMPRKPDHINGSDWITSYPDLSRTLKQCAELCRKFLPYFTQGRLVGECVLAEPNSTVHLTAYILEDKVLAIAVNTAT